MVNVDKIISWKMKGAKNASSSRPDKEKSSSPVRGHPSSAPSGGSRRLSSAPESGSRPHSRSRPQGVETSARIAQGGGLGASHSKRSKPDITEPIRHGKGKQLCPHLRMMDPSKDLWGHPELGAELTRHHIREVDMAYLGPRSTRELIESTFCDIARIPAGIQAIGERALAYSETLAAYQDLQVKAEESDERCRSLTQELSELKLDRDTSRKLEEEMGTLRKELKIERTSGRGFFESSGGQRFMTLHDEGVIATYKNSDAFTEDVEKASVSVFDDCVAYCQERLIKSGRYPGDNFEFLDPTWVEMIEGSPSGHSAAARAAQGTRLLPPDDDAMELGGDDAT